MTETQNSTQVWQELIARIENTQDFVLEQAPDVVQQAFRYEKITTIVSVGVMTILLAGALGIAYYFWKNPTLDKYGSRELLSAFGVFIPLIAAIPLFVQLYSSVDRLIKIQVAPKYFLINLISGLKY